MPIEAPKDKKNNGNHASAPIYSEYIHRGVTLFWTHWDDSPNPHITVCMTDFAITCKCSTHLVLSSSARQATPEDRQSTPHKLHIQLSQTRPDSKIQASEQAPLKSGFAHASPINIIQLLRNTRLFPVICHSHRNHRKAIDAGGLLTPHPEP